MYRCWLALLLLLLVGSWGIGTLLLLFPLLTAGILLALLVVAGLLDFAVQRHRRHHRARLVHGMADHGRDLVPLRLQSDAAGDRQRQGEHVPVVTRQQTLIYDN
jgi:hypothetical protein